MNIFAPSRVLLVLASVLTFTFSGLAVAEPPSRVARLGYIDGSVSFSPAGDPDWGQAVINRPLTTGDRLWVDADSRVELQVGGAAMRLGSSTSVTLLNLDDRIAQVQLLQGTLKVRVRRLAPGQTFEVDTPNLAFTLRRPGEYRIDVDPENDATEVVVLSGEGEVYGEGASYVVNRRQGYRFYGSDLSDYETLEARSDDDLDRWARNRDLRADNSTSARYLSSDVIGYEDLDASGTWRTDPSYGNVWTPTRVSAGWTPYRDGHWVWVDPWGWTWIDDAPWGFAVSHYGRWTHIRGVWGWVPGPRREPAVYAPALVAFVGGSHFQASISIGGTSPAAVGWFPLAPREVYRPAYPVGRRYFDRVNRSNAVIAPTTITNVYNTTRITNTTINNTTQVTQVVYANQRVSGAVVAVPAQAFVESRSVARAAMPLTREAAIAAVAAPVAGVAPVRQSLHGRAERQAVKPPVRERKVVARTAPPPPPMAFATQQQQLAAKPGTPIDEAQRRELKPAAPQAQAPQVKVVTAVQAPKPTALPPVTSASGRSPGARRADAAKAEAPRGRVRQADTLDTEAASPEVRKAEPAAARATPDDRAKAMTPRSAVPTDERARTVETAQPEAVQADRPRGNAGGVESNRGSAARIDAARPPQAQAERETGQKDAAPAAAAPAAGERAEAVKSDASRAARAEADASKAEARRSASARAEAARTEAARAQQTRANAAKPNADRANAERANVAKDDAGRPAGPAPQARPPAPPPRPPVEAQPPTRRDPTTQQQEKKDKKERNERRDEDETRKR